MTNVEEVIHPEDTQIEKLKHQMNHYKRENERMEKELQNRDWLLDNVKDSLAVLSPPIKYKIKRQKEKHSEQKLVALFSDCQACEKIEAEENNICNYDFNIFKTRFRRWLDAIIRITNIYRESMPINDLHIFGLGDYLEGQDIYFGQGSRVENNIIVQLFSMIDLLCQAFSELSRYYRKVNILWLAGNHGRVGKKGQYKWYVNWEYIMGRFMQEKLKLHDNITIDVPMSWWQIVKIYDWGFYCTHGDDIRRYMSIPWYGTERMDNKMRTIMRALGKDYQYLIFGHHHEGFDWDAPIGARICNGCFNYGNPFALKKMHALSVPKQRLFGVHRQWGISFEYKIRLDMENE